MTHTITSVIPQLDSVEPHSEREKLAEIAVSIRRRVGRMLLDIYETGKELMTAREIFGGRGRTKDCIEWAAKETGLNRTTLYGAMATAKAFQPFEATGSMIFFETIEVRILNQISSTNTPKSAREEFVTRVLRGEKFTPEEVNDLIVEHRSLFDAEADEKFVAQRNLVHPWGELRRLEDPEEEYPFYLVDRDGEAHWFRNYTDIHKQYTGWKTERLKAQVDQAADLLKPHWSIQLAPARKQPERVVVDSQIPGLNKELVIASPASVMKWWDQEGQAKTEQLLSNPQTILESSTELFDKLKLEKASCRDCRWHDPQHEGNRAGIWCGYYQDAFSPDRVSVMPLHCNQYRHESNTDPLPPARPHITDQIPDRPAPRSIPARTRVVPSNARSDSQAQELDVRVDQEIITPTPPLDLEFWLQQIEALPDETLQTLENQLEQITAAIARRKQQGCQLSRASGK